MRESLRQLLESTGSFHHSIRFTSFYFTLFPFNDIKYDYHIPKDKNGTRTFGKRSIYLSLIPTDSVSRRLRLFDNTSSSLGWNKGFSPSIIKLASHTGQKWSTFFYSSRDFVFKLTFLFQVEGFNFKSRSFLFKSRCFNSSRNFFFQVEMFLFKSRFLFQVENFFFMSRFLFQVENFIFHFEIFISSRGFYLMSRIFSCRHFSFQEENFFFISSQNFCSLSQLKARCYPGVLVGISWQW